MILTALIYKDIKQLLRDPKTLVMVLLMPVIVLVMFVAGYGGPGGNIPIAVANLDGGTISWQLISELKRASAMGLGSFEVVKTAYTFEEAYESVRKGEVYAAIIIPKGFTEEVFLGEETQVGIILDASYADISERVYRVLVLTMQGFQQKVAEKYGGFTFNIYRVTIYGPEVSKIDAFLGVVMSVLLHLVPMSLIAVSISRERERRTFEQLIMTPISSYDIIMGKLLAYMIVTMADTFLTLGFAVYVFKVRVVGSFLDLMVVSFLILICSLSMGLLISVLSKNQLQAYQMAIFAFIPSMLFSGFLVPAELLSPKVKIVSKLLPLYYFLKAFRNIQIRGWTLYDNLFDALMLIGETIVFLLTAIKLLKLRVE